MDNSQKDVLRLRDQNPALLQSLLRRFGLSLRIAGSEESIEGSFWGDEEAGLVGDELVLRQDTPLHSALHEACHYVCMDGERRDGLHTDAGGGYDEENGVCYLQILLSDEIPGFGRQRMMNDMDRWGYSFRLGSARAWFEEDAEDALAWLQGHGLADEQGDPTFTLRA